VHTVRPDGTDERALTNENDVEEYDPDWSPDGTRLAFVRASALDDSTARAAEVFAMPAEGGAAVQQTVTRARAYRKPVEIRTLAGGLVSKFLPAAQPTDVTLSNRVAATISRGGRAASIEIFDASSGTRLGRLPVPKNAAKLSASGWTVVFASGRRIWALDARTRSRRLVATAAADPVGLSIEGRRIAWAENLLTSARIRGLVLR
jgi:Tol biopolymer transport system component